MNSFEKWLSVKKAFRMEHLFLRDFWSKNSLNSGEMNQIGREQFCVPAIMETENWLLSAFDGCKGIMSPDQG